MSADQRPVYQAAPITQRDGSALANSNCRMASIATGIDFDTRGAKRSTGSKMRSYTDDQSGGTDSGDAKQSWSRGYNEGLTVRDGQPFDNALADLRAGRLVHLDVWHATVGGPCLSGSGAYGHTMAVAPDCAGGSWLVADPWCSPGKWTRVTESKLRAGAEEWGRRVYGTVRAEADYPTDGPGPTDLRVLVIVARIVRRLMALSYPGHETPIPPGDPDTGGSQPVLFTATAAQPLGGQDVGINFNAERWQLTKDLPVFLESALITGVTTLKAGAIITTLGGKAEVSGDGYSNDAKSVLVVTGGLTNQAHQQKAILWLRGWDLDSLTPIASTPGWDDSIWAVALNENARYPCPDDGDGSADCADQVAAAVADRDEDWEAWVLEGAPNQVMGS